MALDSRGLRFFGYRSEEIDQMLSDGAIHRPQSWKRYHARVRVVEVEPGQLEPAANGTHS